MILSFIDTMQEWIEPFREFVFKHHNNPIFWMIIIGVTIIAFFLGYKALHKDSQL